MIRRRRAYVDKFNVGMTSIHSQRYIRDAQLYLSIPLQAGYVVDHQK